MLRRPVRDVDAGYRVPSACNSQFAIVRVDFEPAETYEFVDIAPERLPSRDPRSTEEHWADILSLHTEDDHRFKDAFTDAMRVELAGAAIRVVLTRFGHHTVDGSERGFAMAARRAVRELHRRVPFELAEPVRGVHARHAGTYLRGDPYSCEITLDFEPADHYRFVRQAGAQEHADIVDRQIRTEIGTPRPSGWSSPASATAT